ncbi:MAG: NACHT domain-containing protein [Acidobacteria bacterium]|nr:NACHT domain-containing protein [Acidobacteriota bacterium]
MLESIQKLLLALATQVPLVGGLWLKWSQVQQRPLAAAAIGVVYEGVVAAAAFFNEVWKEELRKDAVKATADWVRAAVRNFRPGFRRTYYKQIIREYGVFNVRGLGLINAFVLKLDQVFVDLRIAPSFNPHKPNSDLTAPPLAISYIQEEFGKAQKASPGLIAPPLPAERLRGNRPVWDFLRIRTKKDEQAAALAIIGPPGCGKTTLLQHIALTLAGNRQRRYRLRAYVPLLLFLRDHIAAITEDSSITLGTLAQKHLSNHFRKLKPPPGWFERQLENGKCMVLLDGLDEVAEKEKRKAVAYWVDRQIRSYPACRFVISSRPQGYRDAALDCAHVVEVQPFDAQQVRRFVTNWHLANELVASGKKKIDEEVSESAEGKAEDLIQRLNKLPALSALTVNPLLLTMIAMVHRYHDALPGSRAELYNQICEVLLGRWRESRGVKDRLNAAQKRVVLEPLAAEMMKRRVREIETDDAMEIVGPNLKSVGLSDAEAKMALSDFQAATGLLLEREAGHWSFAHLTFQEYLTSAYWLEHREAAPDWNILVGDSWWHETLRLYGAKGNATSIVCACIKAGTVAALTLAADCLEEARQLDLVTREKAEARLVGGLESDAPELRRLAAEVQLSRRLKSLQRIDEQCDIDLNFVTCSEYQLFLDDLRTQGKYNQPDHWDGVTFPSGQALTPVRGVRAEDALAFCEWLTQRNGGGWRYRLPYGDESEDWKSEESTLGWWCVVGQGFQLTGILPMQEQAIARQLQKIGSPVFPLPAITNALDLALEQALALAFRPTLAITFAIASKLVHDLTLARSHALDLARVRELARSRARANELARDLDKHLDLALDLTKDLSKVHDLNRTLNHRAFDLIRNRAFDLARRLDSDRYNAVDLDLAHELDVARDRAFALALSLTHNHLLFYDQDVVLSHALDHAYTLAYDIDLVLAHAHPGVRASNFAALADLVEEGKLTEAQAKAASAQSDSNKYVSCAAAILEALLNIVLAKSEQLLQQARRQYAARLLEYAYGGFSEMSSADIRPWWQQWLRPRRQSNDEEDRKIVLNAYWWLQIVNARAEGKLPAWEGIRIVRERVQA